MQKNAKTELVVFICYTLTGRQQQGTWGEILHRMSAPDFHGTDLDLIWQKKHAKSSGFYLAVMDKLK